MAGNTEGARKSAKQFLQTTPGLSHVIALGQKICGEDIAARETFAAANHATSCMINSVPVLGHAKGVYHSICGDGKDAKEAHLAATRSVMVIVVGAGVYCFPFAGPTLAAVASAATGMD